MLESTDSIVHAVWTRMNKYEISVSIVEHATSRRSQLPQQGKQLLASLVRGRPEPAGKPFVARDLRRSRWRSLTITRLGLDLLTALGSLYQRRGGAAESTTGRRDTQR